MIKSTYEKFNGRTIKKPDPLGSGKNVWVYLRGIGDLSFSNTIIKQIMLIFKANKLLLNLY